MTRSTESDYSGVRYSKVVIKRHSGVRYSKVVIKRRRATTWGQVLEIWDKSSVKRV